jgi:hypothetical protein
VRIELSGLTITGTIMDNNHKEMHPRFHGRKRNGQFASGFCGNKKGRPTKPRSTRAVFQRMLTSKVQLSVDGRIAHLSVVEAMAARMKREALTGPLRGLERGIAVAERYSLPERDEKDIFDFSSFTNAELREWGRLAEKATGIKLPAPPGDPDDNADSSGEEPAA